MELKNTRHPLSLDVCLAFQPQGLIMSFPSLRLMLFVQAVPSHAFALPNGDLSNPRNSSATFKPPPPADTKNNPWQRNVYNFQAIRVALMIRFAFLVHRIDLHRPSCAYRGRAKP